LQKRNPDRPPKYPPNGQKPQMRHDIGHFPPKQAIGLSYTAWPNRRILRAEQAGSVRAPAVRGFICPRRRRRYG
jgi:hypothetical protein